MAIPISMGKSRVTAKFQVTLPADVRTRVPFRAGELVEIEAEDDSTVRVRRIRKVSNPLEHLIGRKPWFPKAIPPERVDEMAEP